MPENRDSEAGRDGKGRFQKGKSGNPGGVPAKTVALRKKLESGASKAVSAVVAAAAGGDMSACRLILERVVPQTKPTYPPLSFDLDDSDLPATARSILRAVADGLLPTDQGKLLLDGLASMAKVIEVSELREMVERLEEEINNAKRDGH